MAMKLRTDCRPKRIEVVRTSCDAIRLIGRLFSHHDTHDTDQSLRGLLASELTDWLVVLEAANHHAITPALWAGINRRNLAHLLPADVRTYLGMLYDLNRQRNDLIREQVLDAARCLNRHNVRPLLMKGALTLLENTGEESAAIMTDIDFLVKHDEIESAGAALRSIGYDLLGEPSGRAHAFTFHRPMSLVTIDLHWDVGPQRALLPPEAVYAAAQPINRDDASIYGFAIRHRVLMLIMTFGVFERHYLAGHIPMRGLINLDDLCRQHQGEVDWEQILEMTDRHQLRAQAACMLHMANELMAFSLPVDLRQHAMACRHLRRCFRQLVHPTFDRVMRAYAALVWPFNDVRMDYRHHCGMDYGPLMAARARHAMDVLIRRSHWRAWPSSILRRQA
jgi:hypothetical protein